MKTDALTTFLKDDKNLRKVYLLNQNYAHGHQMVQLAKENLARKRPDVEIVGEDLQPSSRNGSRRICIFPRSATCS